MRVLHFSAFHSAKQLVGVTLTLGLVYTLVITCSILVVNLTLLQCSAQVNRFPNTNGLWFQGVWCIHFSHTHTHQMTVKVTNKLIQNIVEHNSMFITIQVV